MSLGYAFQTGVSALKSFSDGLEVIGNNVSNVSTSGYKKSRAEYADTFYNALQNQGRTMQTGSGEQVKSVSTNFDTEDSSYTGLESDIAINGQGFFRVTDPKSGSTFFTRCGNFTRDSSGYLVTSEGYRVQGSGTLAGSDIQVPEKAVNPTTGLSESVSSWSFSSTTGELSLYFSDGTALSGGQIQLSNFTNPQGLSNQGGNMYKQTNEAGTRTEFLPADNQLATVKSQYLEQSNVDLTDEMSKMIVTQRGFQAGSRVITTTDQLMQDAIKMKS
jgi:flagellar hook protein FlgE